MSYSRPMTDADRPAPVPEPSDIASQRASDADRDAVAERLRVAAGEGRIEPWELDERLGQAYGAKTYGQLADLVADLPGQPPFSSFPGIGAEPDTLVLRTTTPNIRQAGRGAARRAAGHGRGPAPGAVDRRCRRHRRVLPAAALAAAWVSAAGRSLARCRPRAGIWLRK